MIYPTANEVSKAVDHLRFTKEICPFFDLELGFVYLLEDIYNYWRNRPPMPEDMTKIVLWLQQKSLETPPL